MGERWPPVTKQEVASIDRALAPEFADGDWQTVESEPRAWAGDDDRLILAKEDFHRELPGAEYRWGFSMRFNAPVTCRIYMPRVGFLGRLGFKEVVGVGRDQYSYATALTNATQDAIRALDL